MIRIPRACILVVVAALAGCSQSARRSTRLYSKRLYSAIDFERTASRVCRFTRSSV